MTYPLQVWFQGYVNEHFACNNHKLKPDPAEAAALTF